VNRIDLINLESPFHAEPKDSLETSPSISIEGPKETFQEQYAAAWSAIKSTSRGWCESSPEALSKVLEAADMGFIISTAWENENVFIDSTKLRFFPDALN
jgi:hypothetical protein